MKDPEQEVSELTMWLICSWVLILFLIILMSYREY